MEEQLAELAAQVAALSEKLDAAEAERGAQHPTQRGADVFVAMHGGDAMNGMHMQAQSRPDLRRTSA